MAKPPGAHIVNAQDSWNGEGGFIELLEECRVYAVYGAGDNGWTGLSDEDIDY